MRAGFVLSEESRRARTSVRGRWQRHSVPVHIHLLRGGVTCITSGGAGDFLYPSNADRGFNPHSVVMAPRHHWCRLVLAEGRLELAAVALDDGTVIDRHAFVARDQNR